MSTQPEAVVRAAAAQAAEAAGGLAALVDPVAAHMKREAVAAIADHVRTHPQDTDLVTRALFEALRLAGLMSRGER